MINWEVVGWTCITIAFLVGIVGLILAFISAKNIKKRTSQLKDLHTDLKPGMKIAFCGGIHGKVVKVNNEEVDVEVSKNVIITVSRYSIQGSV